METKDEKMLIATFLLLLLSCFIASSIVFWSWKNGISPMPSSQAQKKTILKLMPKDIKGCIYELGAGFGTLAFALADSFPHCKIKAYENSPLPYFFCRLRQFIFPRGNLTFFCSDFYLADLQDAKASICYLYPGAMKNLRGKFLRELQPGAVVISNTFALPGLTPINTQKINDIYQTKIYLYEIKSLETYLPPS